MITVVKDDVKKLKSYSIFSPPSQKDTLDVCIKIVEGGFASQVFDVVEVGEVFEMKGPFGRFLFQPNNKNNFFEIFSIRCKKINKNKLGWYNSLY